MKFFIEDSKLVRSVRILAFFMFLTQLTYVLVELVGWNRRMKEIAELKLDLDIFEPFVEIPNLRHIIYLGLAFLFTGFIGKTRFRHSLICLFILMIDYIYWLYSTRTRWRFPAEIAWFWDPEHQVICGIYRGTVWNIVVLVGTVLLVVLELIIIKRNGTLTTN